MGGGGTVTGNRNRNIRKQHLLPNVSETRSRNTKGKPIAGGFTHLLAKAENAKGGVVKILGMIKFQCAISDFSPKYLGGGFCSL